MKLLKPKLYTSIQEAEQNPQRVRRLQLFHADLDECAAPISEYVQLEELEIGWCPSTDRLADIVGLKRLKSFVCLNSPLHSLPDWLFSCDQLERLKVRGSGILEISNAICFLPRLRDVDFGNNGLLSVPGELGLMQGLRSLGLSDNRLRHIPSSISNLPNLAFLGLVNNSFDQREAENIRGQFRPGVVVL